MLAIPLKRKWPHYDVILILRDENIERIKRHDPAELDLSKFQSEFHGLTLWTIQICYVTPEEYRELESGTLSQAEVMSKLCAGWAFRPELGDSDDNYRALVPPN